MEAMTTEQRLRVVEALVDFIERVAKGKTTSEAETLVLPEVVKAADNMRIIYRQK